MKNAFPKTMRSTPNGLRGSSRTSWSNASVSWPPTPIDTTSFGRYAGWNGVTAWGKRPSPVKRSGEPSATDGFVNPATAPEPGAYEITEVANGESAYDARCDAAGAHATRHAQQARHHGESSKTKRIMRNEHSLRESAPGAVALRPGALGGARMDTVVLG